MFIKAGATRIVIFTPTHAVKIARIPVFSAMKAFVRSLVRKFRSKTKFRFTKNRIGLHARALGRHMFGVGILANRAEAKYWRDTQDEKCIPTTNVLFWGWVIVQRRGEKVSKEDVLNSTLSKLMLTDPEFRAPHQFARYKGRVVVVDYASLGDPSLGAVV